MVSGSTTLYELEKSLCVCSKWCAWYCGHVGEAFVEPVEAVGRVGLDEEDYFVEEAVVDGQVELWSRQDDRRLCFFWRVCSGAAHYLEILV